MSLPIGVVLIHGETHPLIIDALINSLCFLEPLLRKSPLS